MSDDAVLEAIRFAEEYGYNRWQEARDQYNELRGAIRALDDPNDDDWEVVNASALARCRSLVTGEPSKGKVIDEPWDDPDDGHKHVWYEGRCNLCGVKQATCRCITGCQAVIDLPETTGKRCARCFTNNCKVKRCPICVVLQVMVVLLLVT